MSTKEYQQVNHTVNVLNIDTQQKGESFEDEAHWLSKLTLSWMDPIFTKGFDGTLVHEQLGHASASDSCLRLYEDFMKHWTVERQKPKKKRSLFRVLYQTSSFTRIFVGLGLYATYAALSYGPVIILDHLTSYLQGTENLSLFGKWMLVSLIFVIPVIASLCAAHSNVIMLHVGVQFRNVLINMIYRKALRLSQTAKQGTSTGQIVNMFSNDTAQIQRFIGFCNIVIIAPAQIAVSLALIYGQLGVSTFVGLGLLVMLMPCSGMLFGYVTMFRQKKVKVTDVRVKLMNEILAGIRVIKSYAWENAFIKKITSFRNRELVILKYIAYVFAIGFTLILMSAPVLQPVLTFYCYARLGNQLDSARAFTSIALFNMMQFPFTFLPFGIMMYSQASVSAERMLNFFDAEELDDYVIDSQEATAIDGIAIKLEHVDASWIKEEVVNIELDKFTSELKEMEGYKAEGTLTSQSKQSIESSKDKSYKTIPSQDVASLTSSKSNRAVNTLIDVSIAIPKGKLAAVVGPVGCGKSSFLSMLLGELHLKAGSVRLTGSIAYCDQRPWILNTTVRDNILFGKEYNEEKFDLAIHAANLEDDIRVLPGGILTEIGEKGINLSGGQKARVALARAVYCDADVYLLDDPLSAVDAHVGQHIFQECILKSLENKTRVLVTHHVHLLSQCDYIIIIDEGKIRYQGTYEEMKKEGINVEEFIPIEPIEPIEAIEAVDKDVSKIEDNVEEKKMNTNTNTPIRRVASSEVVDNLSKAKAKSLKSITRYDSQDAKEAAFQRKLDRRSSSIMTMEEKKLGDVESSTYSYYIRAGGVGLFVLACFFMIIGQGFSIVSSFWLAAWGMKTSQLERQGGSMSMSESIYYLDYFAMWSCLFLFCYVLRSLVLAEHRLGTSSKLHEDLLHRILAAPISFFDITPLGRILNRFSSDMLTIDEELSQSISQVVNTLFGCIGALLSIVIATTGTFMILLVPIIYIYNLIQKYFRKTNTTIARMESISRSPIYADFSQTLIGLNSIRAYGKQDRFIKTLEYQVDHNTIANVTSQIAAEWLAIRLDFLGAIVTCFIAILGIASPKGFVPAGWLALALASSFQVTVLLKFCVRMIATLEAQMNAVERIMYYIANVEQEDEQGDNSPTGIAVSETWPSEGKIIAKDIQLRYREGPIVIKGLSFDVNSQEKVGIVGRTGSGKSSLIIGLFRIEELAAGSIYIDDVDISMISLSTLRSRIGIIPQDPVMFSASIRFNLDPFNDHTDEEIWDVLQNVNMKEHILTLPNKLMEEVAEGGDNFSAGQRQLICIGRAILRHPKILVLDEATASIDNETDAMIQSMVRQQFQNATVLTIAHRLHTIIDSDRILVLDSGLLAEYDKPEELLKNEDGVFRGLWDRHQSSLQQTSESTET